MFEVWVMWGIVLERKCQPSATNMVAVWLEGELSSEYSSEIQIVKSLKRGKRARKNSDSSATVDALNSGVSFIFVFLYSAQQKCSVNICGIKGKVNSNS